VKNEINRINNKDYKNDLVIIDKLRKIYPTGKVGIE
jgi:hypothetical protein